MPELTPDVPLVTRGYIVHDALATDAGLTAGTFWNAYGLSFNEAASRNLYMTERTIYLASESEQRITFVETDAGLTQRPTNELCLQAGVA